MKLDNDLAELKERMDAQGGAAAFPYNGKDWKGIRKVEGLERLRFIADRTMAANLYEQWFDAQQRERRKEREFLPPGAHRRAELLSRAQLGKTRDIWSDAPVERDVHYHAVCPENYDPDEHYDSDYHQLQSKLSAEWAGFNQRLAARSRDQGYDQFDEIRHTKNFEEILKYRYGYAYPDQTFRAWAKEQRAHGPRIAR